MTHQSYEENVGAYALGALPELERQAFERHVQGCEDCRREVERLRPGAQALPRAVTPLTPPPRLKASLMEVVKREARERARPARNRRRLAGLVAPLPRLRPAAAWIGAALLLGLGLATGFALSETIGDGGTRTVAGAVRGTRVPSATARLVIPAGERVAVLRVNGLPTLGPDAIYQAWVKRDGEVVSQSLFSVGRDGKAAAAIPDSLEEADAVMVTREPAGGSRAPTQKPVLTVGL